MTSIRKFWLGTAIVVPAVAIFALELGACSSSNPTTAAACAAPDGGAPAITGAGFTTKPFAPPCDPGSGGILFSASGEVLALRGFKFPPNDPVNDTYMIDGWDFVLTEYISVFDHITLWDNPNAVPMDQSKHGAVVAHVDGPWVADLHKGGPLAGKGGAGEQATPITAIAKMDNGHAFDPATTYAFGFSTVAASASGAYNVNLDASEAADYAYMVQNGHSVLYVGTATWAGGTGNPLGPCTQTNAGLGAAPGPTDGGDDGGSDGASAYDYSKMPARVLSVPNGVKHADELRELPKRDRPVRHGCQR